MMRTFVCSSVKYTSSKKSTEVFNSVENTRSSVLLYMHNNNYYNTYIYFNITLK